MTNSELINAYLDNELNDADRQLFEARLNEEPALRQELDIHKDIIEGIRNARKAQLKHRLNQVDVGGNAGWSTGQILGTIAIVAAGITAVYFLYPSKDAENAESAQTDIIETETLPAEDMQAEQIIEQSGEVAENAEEEVVSNTAEEAAPKKEITEAVTADAGTDTNEDVERQPEVKRPVIAPSFENDDAERLEVTAPDGAVLGEVVTGTPHVDVEVIRDLPNRNFHYAFENSTLKLYGDFDDALYEILEFNSNKGKRWFLSYRGKFYNLDSSAAGLMPLREITDNKLLDVLNDIH